MADTSTTEPTQLDALLAERQSLLSALDAIRNGGQAVQSGLGTRLELLDFDHAQRRLNIVEARISTLKSRQAGFRNIFERI